MTQKKRTWKFWIRSTLLLLLIIGAIWIINLIWFKPFNINHFYEKVFVELLLDSPELSTQLGVPVIKDLYKDELDDISDVKLWANHRKVREDYQTLISYDFEKQLPENQLNTKILAYFQKMNSVEKEPFFYHNYPVNQTEGIQSHLPELLTIAHELNNDSDIKAYISRLSKFDVKFSQLIENLKIRESKGIIPPKFINDLVLDQMKKFVGEKTITAVNESALASPATSNVLYTNFETKVDEIEDILEEQKTKYKKEVADAIEKSVIPAYRNLIAYVEKLNETATNDAGVWKLPNGDAYYRYMLKMNTTTELEPDEVYEIGISEVSRIKKEMLDILKSEGYADSSKTIGEIVQKLNSEDRFLFSNDKEGREMILAEYERILSEAKPLLKQAFNITPKAGLEVRRVAEFKEEGGFFAYYVPPALDGSRGGVFYVNLRNGSETVKFGMKTLAYHEGIPGHHFQLAIQNELEGLPTFRKVIPFIAYGEGWALYAERLAWELGFYENDPFGNLGRLQAEMFRAVRLVVDVGIHHKKWTREEAIHYMIAHTGKSTSDVTSEIERYIVNPGQACAYKIGMLKILELREKAKQKLGDQFDLRKFHDAVLKNGSVPLDILEEIIDNYIDETLKTRKS